MALLSMENEGGHPSRGKFSPLARIKSIPPADEGQTFRLAKFLTRGRRGLMFRGAKPPLFSIFGTKEDVMNRNSRRRFLKTTTVGALGTAALAYSDSGRAAGNCGS
jgi:hypothetical protein